MLSEEEIRHVARIARIDLSEEEIRRFREEFERIFELLERVKELPLAEDAPVVATENRSEFRKDEAKSFPADEILRNVPRRKERYVVVPKNL